MVNRRLSKIISRMPLRSDCSFLLNHGYLRSYLRYCQYLNVKSSLDHKPKPPIDAGLRKVEKPPEAGLAKTLKQIKSAVPLLSLRVRHDLVLQPRGTHPVVAWLLLPASWQMLAAMVQQLGRVTLSNSATPSACMDTGQPTKTRIWPASTALIRNTRNALTPAATTTTTSPRVWKSHRSLI